MRHLPLEAWLDLLENRHPVKIDLGLERVATVAARLGVLKPAPLVISIAGTNGKGSCVAVLERLLIESGRRVGSFTSPHLLRFNERISLQGVPVEDAPISRAFAEIEVARGETRLTYFEFSTLAALLIMQHQHVDVALLEVGLGGRLDAVNIVDADVAVITSIDLDHTEWLGADRGKIALEKAGIARSGRPLVCADPDPPADLQSLLLEKQVPALYVGQDFSSVQEAESGLSLRCRVRDGTQIILRDLPLPRVPFGSAMAALQALHAAGINLDTASVARAFTAVALPGRYQRLRYRKRRVIVDVAHNPAAASHLAKKLAVESAASCLLVAAIMKDKDARGFVKPLLGVSARWYLGNLPGHSRALAADQLAAVLYNAGVKALTFPDVETSLEAAVEAAGPDDIVVVCGSFITAGAALASMSPDQLDNE